VASIRRSLFTDPLLQAFRTQHLQQLFQAAGFVGSAVAAILISCLGTAWKKATGLGTRDAYGERETICPAITPLAGPRLIA
jgi:hypothetical protein